MYKKSGFKSDVVRTVLEIYNLDTDTRELSLSQEVQLYVHEDRKPFIG